jgi:anti-anti-sigma factor
MQVFLSWSGKKSERTAEALKPFLEQLLPGVKAWKSDHDIPAGTPWGTVLHEQLRGADFGILCLTPDNLTAPWVLYEAGALAMSSKVGCVVPFRLEVGPDELPAPLAQFQSVEADLDGVWKIIRSINERRDDPAAEVELWVSFEGAWPGLADRLDLGVQESEHGDVTVLTPRTAHLSRIDAVSFLREKVRELIRAGRKRIVLDLAAWDRFTSMGLAVLISGARAAASDEGAVVLANLSPTNLEVLEMTRLMNVLPHFPSVAEAIASFDR